MCVETVNDYYVYGHFRKDNDTCFYVGKGHGKRMSHASRNEHHDRIAAKCGWYAKTFKEGLSEEEAYNLERKVISYFVFDLGYGIDIDGYRKPDSDKQLTNCTFGGDGSFGMVHTEEWRKQHSLDMMGTKNPMYGVNVWDSYDDDKRQAVKDKISEASSGKNNPMYGVSPQERMDEKTYAEWKNKTHKRLAAQTGSSNPNYGNNTLHEKLEENPELRLEYYSRKGNQNGRARGVQMFKDEQLVKEFSYIGECCEYIKSLLDLDTKIATIRIAIIESIKDNKPYRGFTFAYI